MALLSYIYRLWTRFGRANHYHSGFPQVALGLLVMANLYFPQSVDNPKSLPRPVDYSLLLVFSFSITLLISFGESSRRP